MSFDWEWGIGVYFVEGFGKVWVNLEKVQVNVEELFFKFIKVM